MNLPEDKKQDELRLRATAERQIDNAPRDEPLARTAEELLHELQVHQVELEMQNEALRQAQIALAESRDRYVDLFEFAPLGYLTLSAEGMIEEINLTGAALLGKERNNLLQRDFTSVVIAEDQPRWIRHFLDVKQGDGERSVELALQRGDGTLFQAQLDCARAEGLDPPGGESTLGVRADGETTKSGRRNPGARIALSDISERKRADEMLRQSEDKYRRLFEDAAIGIFHSIDDRFADVNPALARMLGYDSPQEAIRSIHSISEQVYADPPRRAEIAAGALAKDGAIIAENRYRRKDGAIWIGNLILRSVTDEHGQPPYFEGFVEDISERKRAEEAVKRSELRLRTIVETEPECVKVVDRDGQLTEMNAAGLAMLEAGSLDEAQECRLADYLLPEYRAAFMDLHQRVTGGESGILAFEIKGRKGTRRWLETHAAPLRDETGTVVALLGITRDITERKQAEAERVRLETQLRESQKMEALGTLAGGVAHDFNNALAAILGNVELARQDVGPDHAALVSLEEIDKASRRARDLVQQILAFGRRQKLERKVMSLALVVVETARLLRATFPAMVSLSVDCKGDTPAVLADATQVKQLLLNLCDNALQAVQDQGRPGVIDVRLESHTRVEARGDLRPGRYACLTVRDNGPGMDEATRTRVFEPFFTTKPAGKGTGLGLAVVHGIVHAHEAHIEVESTPGEGSTFRIYFPAVEVPLADVIAPAPVATPVQGKGKHVLYLDDEEAIIFLMKRLLERRGYRVSGYTEPRKALAAARADPGQFDLAVTDYFMPGMSGLEVAQALKEIRPDLPVVMASGYISEELRAKAPAVGIRELIYKPNTVEDLCEAVARFANAQT